MSLTRFKRPSLSDKHIADELDTEPEKADKKLAEKLAGDEKKEKKTKATKGRSYKGKK